jgi:hypothetical protein
VSLSTEQKQEAVAECRRKQYLGARPPTRHASKTTKGWPSVRATPSIGLSGSGTETLLLSIVLRAKPPKVTFITDPN